MWYCCVVTPLYEQELTKSVTFNLLDYQPDKVEMVRQAIVEEALPSMTILDVMGRVGQKEVQSIEMVQEGLDI